MQRQDGPPQMSQGCLLVIGVLTAVGSATGVVIGLIVAGGLGRVSAATLATAIVLACILSAGVLLVVFRRGKQGPRV